MQIEIIERCYTLLCTKASIDDSDYFNAGSYKIQFAPQ